MNRALPLAVCLVLFGSALCAAGDAGVSLDDGAVSVAEDVLPNGGGGEFSAVDSASCGGCAGCCGEVQGCCDCCQPDGLWRSIWGGSAYIDLLPRSLLWEIPLANQREPRLFAKFFSLDDATVIDTAIGGEVGLVRLSPGQCWCEAVQLDLFAVAFTRFLDIEDFTTADYRVGLPLTYACGAWQAKLGYEHTSSHLGDEFIQNTGAQRIASFRDEIVVGLARRFGDALRIYAQAGYAFHQDDNAGEDPMRYDWGVELRPWCDCGVWLKPFCAFDMDLRADQNYQPNTTVQVGLVLKDMENGRSVRIAAEHYNGKSPYGQFFQQKESWTALSLLYDW